MTTMRMKQWNAFRRASIKDLALVIGQPLLLILVFPVYCTVFAHDGTQCTVSEKNNTKKKKELTLQF